MPQNRSKETAGPSHGRSGATVIKIKPRRPDFTPDDARLLRGLIEAEREADRQAGTKINDTED